jgi:uncharacterized protein (TIRG00374 family)
MRERERDQREREHMADRLERALEQHADVEHEIERGEAEQPSGPSLRSTIIWLAVTGVSLYLVAPSLIEVLGSAEEVVRLEPAWLLAMAVLQVASLTCLWEVQRLALHERRWKPVIASQLAANAMAKIAPAGGAVGSALQYRMLVEAGVSPARSVAGLTASNLLVFAMVLALPVLAVPAIIRGGVNRSLVEATILGLVVFVILVALAYLALARDRPLRWLGTKLQALRNRIRRKSPPVTTLPARLLRERDRILQTLGPRWKRALVATAGRWAFDYASLLAALAAVGSQPRPALVLLAFCAAQLLTQIPITPGGVGFVEAGLTATLALAGVSAGNAALATLAYRLFTYWLPLPLGALGIALHKRWTARGIKPGQPGYAPTDERAP